MSKFNIFTIDLHVILSIIVVTDIYALLLKFLQNQCSSKQKNKHKHNLCTNKSIRSNTTASKGSSRNTSKSRNTSTSASTNCAQAGRNTRVGSKRQTHHIDQQSPRYQNCVQHILRILNQASYNHITRYYLRE